MTCTDDFAYSDKMPFALRDSIAPFARDSPEA